MLVSRAHHLFENWSDRLSVRVRVPFIGLVGGLVVFVSHTSSVCQSFSRMSVKQPSVEPTDYSRFWCDWLRAKAAVRFRVDNRRARCRC